MNLTSCQTYSGVCLCKASNRSGSVATSRQTPIWTQGRLKHSDTLLERGRNAFHDAGLRDLAKRFCVTRRLEYCPQTKDEIKGSEYTIAQRDLEDNDCTSKTYQHARRRAPYKQKPRPNADGVIGVRSRQFQSVLLALTFVSPHLNVKQISVKHE